MTLYAADRKDGAYLILDLRGLIAVLGPERMARLGDPVEVTRFVDPASRDEHARDLIEREGVGH